MHPCPGNWIVMGHVVVYYTDAFSAEINVGTVYIGPLLRTILDEITTKEMYHIINYLLSPGTAYR